MVRSIVSAGTGLFAAVAVAYLVTWYSGAGALRAQTVAFVTWLLGHVFLALNLRSERELLVKLGLFANRLMIGSDWPVCTLAADYPDVIAIVERHIERLSDTDREAILGGTAARVYGLTEHS